MQAVAYDWMPTLLDSVIPFAFLVAELFMAHVVYGDQRAWLLAAGIGFSFGLAAYALRRSQTDRHQQENVGVVGAITTLPDRAVPSLSLPRRSSCWAWRCTTYWGLGRRRSPSRR